MNKYKELFIYTILDFVFVIIGFYSVFREEFHNAWRFITIVDTSFSVGVAVLVFFAYKDFIKQEDDISFEFKLRDDNDKEKVLKNILRRNNGIYST